MNDVQEKKKKQRILLSVIHVTLVQGLKKKKERQCEKHHTMTGLNETMTHEELVQALPLGNLY